MRLATHLRAALPALLLAGSAAAHDTWLTVQPEAAPGLLTLAMATGDRFPLPLAAPEVSGFAAGGCTDADGQALALRPRMLTPQGLLLRARTGQAPQQPWSCWARTRSLEVTLTAQQVETYLHDIQAPEAVKLRWQQQQQAGRPWREQFTKQARIEHAPDGAAGATYAGLRRPVGSGLDIVPVGERPLRRDEPVVVQVLRDGQPLAGQPVQFVSERSPLGIWRRTDAQGMANTVLPFGGRWLARTVQLAMPADADGIWQSAFSTLAWELPS